jgi:hypothetical protein
MGSTDPGRAGAGWVDAGVDARWGRCWRVRSWRGSVPAGVMPVGSMPGGFDAGGSAWRGSGMVVAAARIAAVGRLLLVAFARRRTWR